MIKAARRFMEPNIDFIHGETANGALKRYRFIVDAIETYKPASVLDVGCGTGALLTAPLAARFPDVRFVGIDPDAASIAYAERAYSHANLEFRDSRSVDRSERFDMVIASEVIEHVEEPIEFLVDLRRHLRSEGTLIVTLPNGYGPYEMTALVESLLHLSGVLPALEWMRERMMGRTPRAAHTRDTLAHSPHINWFTQRRLERVLDASGFAPTSYRGRVFLCGLGLQHLLRNESLRRWNARVADKLPAGLNSGWMFVASKRHEPVEVVSYKRNLYERVRRAISEMRWGTRPVSIKPVTQPLPIPLVAEPVRFGVPSKPATRHSAYQVTMDIDG